MRSECTVQIALDEAGLDLRNPRVGIDRDDTIHVLREIEHQGGVARLAGETGAAAARKYRHRVFPRDRQRGNDVAFMPRNHDANRHLPIVRSVGGVCRAGAGVEAHFAFELAAEFEL